MPDPKSHNNWFRGTGIKSTRFSKPGHNKLISFFIIFNLHIGSCFCFVKSTRFLKIFSILKQEKLFFSCLLKNVHEIRQRREFDNKTWKLFWIDKLSKFGLNPTFVWKNKCVLTRFKIVTSKLHNWSFYNFRSSPIVPSIVYWSKYWLIFYVNFRSFYNYFLTISETLHYLNFYQINSSRIMKKVYFFRRKKESV